MRQRTAYCSACDRAVPVTLREPDARRPAAAAASELVCLDYGTRCTGALCPMFSVPGEEPATRSYGSAQTAPRRAAPGPLRPRTGEGGAASDWRPSPRAD